MRGQGKSELMCDTWKKQNCHSEYTYFISFNKCMWLMIPVSNQLLYKKSGTYLFQDWTDKEQISSSVQTNVCTHILCHFVLATEIGCLCEDDSLSFLSQRLIVFKCFRESVLVYAQRPMSDEANFTQTLNFGGVLSPDPIRCCQSQNSILYLFCLLPSLVSLLVTLPLSNTYSTPLL